VCLAQEKQRKADRPDIPVSLFVIDFGFKFPLSRPTILVKGCGLAPLICIITTTPIQIGAVQFSYNPVAFFHLTNDSKHDESTITLPNSPDQTDHLPWPALVISTGIGLNKIMILSIILATWCPLNFDLIPTPMSVKKFPFFSGRSGRVGCIRLKAIPKSSHNSASDWVEIYLQDNTTWHQSISLLVA